MGSVAAIPNRRAELARLSDSELRNTLTELLQAAVAEAAQRPPQDVRIDWVDPDPRLLFRTVWKYVLRDVGLPLLMFDMPHCHSIPELAAHLARELRTPPAPPAPVGDLDQSAWPKPEAPDRRYEPPIERPILFVLSPPRSGSTLLSMMLGKHPKLYAAGELVLLPFESMGARARTLGEEGAWMRIALFAALKELGGVTDERAEEEGLAMEAQDVPISAVYRRLQALAGDRIVIDKSPNYAASAASLACAERVFRAPLYIHLTRHPGAVIESFVRMRFHRMMGPQVLGWNENPWLFAENVWTIWSLNCMRFLETVDPARQLRISYEALVTDPGATMTRISDFLRIPFDAATLQPYSGSERKGLGMGDPRFGSHTGIHADFATDWQRARPPQSFGRLTREVAAALGYRLE